MGKLNIKGRGFTVRAEDESSDVVDLLIYDAIDDFWGVSAAAVADALTRAKDAKTIRVSVNSPGGDAFAGMAIYNTLRKHSAKVEVEIDGMAASAASLIAMAGDTIRMAKGAMMMIHAPWTITIGDATEHRSQADFLDKLAGQYIDAYVERSGSDEKQITKWVNDETWFDADEAVDAGLADEVMSRRKPDDEDEDKAAASLERSPFARHVAASYRHIPARLQVRAQTIPPRGANNSPDGGGENMKRLFALLGVETEDEACAAVERSTKTIECFKTLTKSASAREAIEAVEAHLAKGETLDKACDAAACKAGELVGTALVDTKAKHSDLLAEHSELKAQIETDKREGLIKAALAEGRCTKARADWLREQPLSTVESFLSVADGVALPGAGKSAPKEPKATRRLSAEELEACKSMDIPVEEWIRANYPDGVEVSSDADDDNEED